MLYNLDKEKSLKLSCGLTTVANKQGISRAVSCFNFIRGVIMLKENYKPFMNLLKQTYDNIYNEEKDEFSAEDAMTITMLTVALDSLYGKFQEELEKKYKEILEE